MATIFTKDISTANLLLAYVNNIVRFRSNYASQTLKCEVVAFGFTKVLFPDPTGYFYYNFKEWVTSMINVDNFKDDLNLDIVTHGYSYDWTAKAYINTNFTFKIYFADNTTEETTKNLKWLSGYMQLENYKKQVPININAANIFLMSPFIKASNLKTYLKYWEGYPFDVTLYNPGSKDITVTNNTNLLDYTFTGNYTITRLAFSDGNDNVTIDDVLPLTEGFNDLKFENDTQYYQVLVEKITQHCGGVYLKWINEFGGWSYWLFYFNGRIRSTKDLGEIENDFEDLADTISPTIQIGHTSQDVIAITSDTINEQEIMLLEGLLDSPKVYMFTGEPYAKNSFNDWIEVSLKTNSLKIKQAKNSFSRFDLQIELPQRNTRLI